MTKRGRQTDLGSALDGVVGRLDRRNGGLYEAARVKAAWRKVADGILLSHTTGVHLREGKLIVFVDGNTWSNHFTAMSEPIRTALNKEIGQDLISELRFIVSRKVEEAHRLESAEREAETYHEPDAVDPVPLSEVELAQVRASVQEIPDEELREAVLRATVKDLEWKKGIASNSKP